MSKHPTRKPLEAPEELSRKHRRLRQEEERKQRILIAIVGVVVGLVLVILTAGLINEFVIKPRRPIASVNSAAINTAAFQRQIRFSQDNLVNQIDQYIQFGQQFASADGANPFAQAIQSLYDQLASPETLSLNVLDDLIETELVRQLAAQNNVTVSDDEVQQEIEKDFGYERTPAPTPTPDPTITETVPGPTPVTLESFQQNYNDVIKGLTDRGSLTEVEFRTLYRDRLLRSKLQEVAPLEVQATEEQAHARHILIQFPEVTEEKTQEQAEAEALAAIQAIRERIVVNGEAFADVAKEVSEDTSNKEQGGDLGWFARGRMVPEFEEAAFTLPVGEVSEPVKTQFGYHLILVEERDPNRPVEESELEQRRNQAFTDWLTAQKDTATIERNWTAGAVPALPSDIRDILANLSGSLFQPTPAATVAPEAQPAPATAAPAEATPASQ